MAASAGFSGIPLDVNQNLDPKLLSRPVPDSTVPTRRRSYPHHPPLLPPCRVCGAKASGHHFGAITCEACKVFFRRSLGREKDYRCLKSQCCDITSDRRASCSSCRLQKCKEVGMSREGVQRGRYTLERKTGCILEAKNYRTVKKEPPIPSPETPPEVAEPMLLPPIPVPDMSNSMLDMVMSIRNDYLDHLVVTISQVHDKHTLYTSDFLATLPEREARYKELKALRESVFGPMNLLSSDMYHEFYRSTGLDVDNRIETINDCISRQDIEHMTYIAFAKELPGWQELPVSDQITLLRGNRFNWWFLSILPAINIDESIFTCSSCGMTYGIDELANYIGTNFISETYRTARIFKRLGLTEVEMALVKSLAVLFTDDLTGELQQKGSVESRQEEIIDALIHHVNKTRPGQNHIVAKIIHALTEARCSRNEYQKIMGTWFDLWPDLNYTPLFLELLKGDNAQQENKSVG